MISNITADALNLLLPFLNSLNRSWCIIGSAGLVLHGIDAPGHDTDIDIVTDEEGATRLDKLLSKFRLVAATNENSPHVQSAVKQYEIGGTTVKVISEVKVKVSESWIKLLEWIEKKEIFDFNGYKVIIPSLRDQLNISQLFGKEKDMKDAEKIKTYLNPQIGG